MAIPSPQFSEEQNRLSSIDNADLREDPPQSYDPADSDIAAYAYQLYEEAGRPTDQAEQHWTEARARLRNNTDDSTRHHPKQASKPSSAFDSK